MKRCCFLLLVTLLSTFYAFAQTHFITAGQTQGMIFTDYVPDEVLYNRHYNGWRNDSIDVNHDGIADMIIRYYVMNNIFGSPPNQGYYNAENLTFTSLVQSVQFACKLDTAVGNAFDECGNGSIKPYHTFTKIFPQNDIILMNNDALNTY